MAVTILINTIPRDEAINALEAAEKGTADDQAFAETLSAPVIDNVNFTVGEWRHVDDVWVEKNAKELEKYSYIKEAHVILEERTRAAIKEKNLDSFAQGIIEAAEVYKQEVPSIAATVRTIAPEGVVKEV